MLPLARVLCEYARNPHHNLISWDVSDRETYLWPQCGANRSAVIIIGPVDWSKPLSVAGR